MPKEYLLAIDIECSGPQLGRQIMAIGVVFGMPDGTVIQKRSFCGNVPPSDEFDPDTWKFWSQFPDILARIQAQAVPDHERAFNNWLEALNIIYGPFGRNGKPKLRLLSDNPGYDLAKIAVRLRDLYGPDAKLVAEMFGYMPTSDPSEQEELATDEQRTLINSYKKSEHNHEPSDDALFIFQNYLGVQAAKRLMQK